jgi:hypothetical protein
MQGGGEGTPLLRQPATQRSGGGGGLVFYSDAAGGVFPMYCTESSLISTQREVLFRLEAKILMMFGFPLFFLGPLSFYPQPYPLLSTLLYIISLH